jgi:stage II sporulation protein D
VVTVTLTAGGFQASWLGPRGREVERFGSRDTAWLATERSDRFIGWDGRTWRGRFKLFVSPRGKLTLASRLPLETYLLGVVPLEIGGLNDTVLEAGRAQAIAARSYTLFYAGRRGDEGFDLYATVEDQVYGPVEAERPLATRCVDGTRGRVALFEGAPIRANYSSTCGGITADVWEGWPVPPLGYLRSRLDAEGGEDFCRASASYRWKDEWPAAELADEVRQFGPQLGLAVPAGWPGQLLDVRVARRSRSGRVRALVVSGTAGDVVIPGFAVRGVLRRPGNRGQILRSNLFKIAVRRDPGDGHAVSVVASGAGSGHGVGLCQMGALGMARAGYRAERILEHYYAGVELKTLYH